MLCIAEQSKRIARAFISRQGATDSMNIYGETQLEMDKWADEVLIDAVSELPFVASVSSEERDDIITPNEDGIYSVTFDPLDGSSLMGVDLTVGTIVGIHDGTTPLRPARELAAAMYILYGPLTVLVYSVGKGVHEFVLDDDREFILQEGDLRFGKDRIYAPGALRSKWTAPHRRFIERLESLDYKLRFCGSMVADVHQVIHKGGVFTYPGIVGKPGGKLRLLFEAGPMGFLAEKAGGGASDGRMSILDLEPTSIDQRVPVYIGGPSELSILEEEMSREV